jgi:hypothetical protein
VIEDLDRMQDRLELMKPIGTLAENVQQQIDLAGRSFFEGAQ